MKSLRQKIVNNISSILLSTKTFFKNLFSLITTITREVNPGYLFINTLICMFLFFIWIVTRKLTPEEQQMFLVIIIVVSILFIVTKCHEFYELFMAKMPVIVEHLDDILKNIIIYINLLITIIITIIKIIISIIKDLF